MFLCIVQYHFPFCPCFSNAEQYLNLVNSMLQGLVTRKYKRKALTYGSCFEVCRVAVMWREMCF